jgi:ABC-2 type transport system ATP-binding protein
VTSSAAITLENVSKKFNDKTVVNNVTLTLEPGKIYTLIGPNGAGKTTLIKMLVGLLSPTSGSISLFGNDITIDPIECKKLFGYIPDDPSAYDYLSGMEFLILAGKLRNMELSTIEKRISHLKNLFPIVDILTQPMSYYSRGNRQKVALLSALIGNPKILFIDEPIVGLDPTSIDIFGNVLLNFKKNGGTVFFVTHTLPFAATYADHVFVMNNGKMVKDQAISSKTSLKNIYATVLQRE